MTGVVMPSKPKTHKPQGTKGTRQQYERDRPTPAARGYDRRWRKVRNAYWQKHPLCENCEAEGRETLAVDVDHRVPFEGLDDPRRLAWDNLQSLCRTCHNRKTRGKGGGAG